MRSEYVPKKRTMLYVILSGGKRKRDCFMKIGITKEGITKRLRKLQTGCPWKMSPLIGCEIESAIARKKEKELHNLLNKHKTHGEWFVVTEEAVLITTEFFMALMMEDDWAGIFRPDKTYGAIDLFPDHQDYVNKPHVKINNLTGKPQRYQKGRPLFNLFKYDDRFTHESLEEFMNTIT